ncbi:Ig-like domain-containing protein [Legionella taurinensis]|uniref:Ig-like domain-containing protein n=1 Tax=Legionella taurinensis TaxID=70611 RepID=UPI0013EFBF8F|nr:Ig-like domain-containing protein [Legionella taurinensis]
MAIKIGSKAVNVLNGGAGNDFLLCFFGTNTLNGGAGNDSLFGGSGKDTLRGGAGSDRIYAGSGNDTIIHDVVHDQGKFDIYDGGRGIDTLILEVSQSFLARADVQTALNAVTSKALPAGTQFSFGGYVPGWNLTIKGIEKLVIKIKGVPVSPSIAIDDVINTQEDTPFVIPAAQLLANDKGGNAILSVDYTGSGNLTFSNGVITYVPVNNYHGTDTFKYTIANGLGGTSVATVTLHVNSVNDEPIAVDDGFSTSGELVISTNDLLTNDTDADGDSLSITDITGGNGTIELLRDATGAITGVKYIPTSSFSGQTTMTYTLTDGHTDAQGTILINVTSSNNGNSGGGDDNGSGPGNGGNNGSGDDGSAPGGGSNNGNGNDGSATSGSGVNTGNDGSATAGSGVNTGSDGSATAGSGVNTGNDGSATSGSGVNTGNDGSATAGSGVNTGGDGTATAGTAVSTTAGTAVSTGSDGTATAGTAVSTTAGNAVSTGSDGTATAGTAVSTTAGTAVSTGSDGTATAGTAVSTTAGTAVSTGSDGTATVDSGVSIGSVATANTTLTTGNTTTISVSDTASVTTGTLTTSTDAVISQVITGYAVTDETQWQVGSALDSSSNDELGVLGVYTVHDELWAG